MEMIKSTINIDKELKEQLETLVRCKKIASLTEGINLAINDFINKQKRSDYEARMALASKDDAFMRRTMVVQEEFEKLDRDINLGDDEW
ncbi:MAG: hypothetical protein K6E87_01630 [bacterium]|nr:hypothetical protein [bacterium]